MSDLIRLAASLLMAHPPLDKEDRPHVPKYYLREVETYVDVGRKAAIEMRKAADRIRELEATLERVRGLPGRWRDHPAPISGTSRAEYYALDDCADELEAALNAEKAPD